MSEPVSFIDFQLLLIELERDRDKWKEIAERFAVAVDQAGPSKQTCKQKFALWAYKKAANREG